MTQDQLFRLLVLVLSVALYVNHHWIHKSPHTKKGPKSMGVIEWMLVVTPTLWAISLTLYVLGFVWFDYSLPLPLWLRWLGVAVMASCYPLSDWVYSTLGSHFSKKLVLRADHKLVDSGPYRYVRHPMYSTLFLCAGATCLISANIFVIAATLSVVVVILLRIRKEEDMMAERFGEAYRTYQTTTGALLPRLR